MGRIGIRPHGSEDAETHVIMDMIKRGAPRDQTGYEQALDPESLRRRVGFLIREIKATGGHGQSPEILQKK